MRIRHLERIRERLERPRPGERKDGAGRLLAVVVLGVPGHVLAEPLLSPATQAHDGRHAGEAARHRLLEPLELVTLALESKRREALP